MRPSNITLLTHPAVNPIYPTDDNLNITLARFMSQLPIEDENELFSMLMIYHNTLIKTIGT